jgi:L-ascorbate metabolism protein UlaG (beta-lactamase superfamily)
MAPKMAEASIRQEDPHVWYWSTHVVEDGLSGGRWPGIGQRGDHRRRGSPDSARTGQNFGGRAQHGSMQTWLVPAVHSNLLGFPSAGFVLEIGGVRLYASGDTDAFGDMRMIADRYHPDIALVCAGGGPYTMGPRDAALACQMTGVSQAVPIHYGHNAQVLGIQAADDFKAALAETAPNATAQVFQLGESRAISA